MTHLMYSVSVAACCVYILKTETNGLHERWIHDGTVHLEVPLPNL